MTESGKMEPWALGIIDWYGIAMHWAYILGASGV